jgi:O-methyltransferase involved in polyketide biosynthesis
MSLPEALLWNLYQRSVAARATEYRFHDPKAVELVERIDYPFDRFDNDHTAYTARWHALRMQTMDAEIGRFLDEHPAAMVVALGEGLETQFWRVDNGTVRWLTVDQLDTVDARKWLLPDGPRRRTVDCSLLRERWMDEVDPTDGLLITAQGLLMYLPLTEVEQLITRCAARFPGAAFVFDAVPARMVDAQGRDKPAKSGGFTPPAWIWGWGASARRRLSVLPGVSELHEVQQAKAPGLLFGVLLPALRRMPGLGELMPTFPVLRAEFAARP